MSMQLYWKGHDFLRIRGGHLEPMGKSHVLINHFSSYVSWGKLMLGKGGWQAFPHALSTNWFSHTHGLGLVFLTRHLGCQIILSTLPTAFVFPPHPGSRSSLHLLLNVVCVSFPFHVGSTMFTSRIGRDCVFPCPDWKSNLHLRLGFCCELSFLPLLQW